MESAPDAFASLRAPDVWDYRPFLRDAIARLRADSPARSSYARLAARFGFKSRSFLQHVLAGKRRLSPESADRVARALGLPTAARRLFMALVKLEHAEDATARERILRSIDRFRRKAAETRAKLPERARARGLFADSSALLVYAAMGDLERGATVAEIAKRTSLSSETVRRSLARLVDAGVSRFSEALDGSPEARYLPLVAHFHDDSPENRAAMRNFYLDSARDAVNRARTDFSAEGRFFAAYAFSVEEARLGELREKLRALLSDFVVESERANGDRVVRLTASIV